METISGRFCPVCKFKNELTATVCVYCGAPLENIHKGETTTRRVDEGTRVLESGQGEFFSEDMVPPKGIAIYAENGGLVGIRQEKEFFLGRKVEEDGEDELVDLVPMGAFHQGVSRRHAVIRRTKHGYEIVDLGSTNGTYVDGKRLVSEQAYPLPGASKVALGRMRLIVLYHNITTKEKTPK